MTAADKLQDWESLEDPFVSEKDSSDEESIHLAIRRDEEIERGEVKPLSHSELMSRLPRNERAFLADRLLSSPGDEALSDIDAAWVTEAEHRYAEYKDGIREPVPAAKVFADADRILG